MWVVVLGTAATALGAALVWANSPWFVPNRTPYDLSKLESTQLVRLDESGQVVSGRDLWHENGAVIMIEATMLSSLLPKLTEKGVPLYGILHEEGGAGKFKTLLKGDLFLDKEKEFYDNRIGILGLVRLSGLKAYWQASSAVQGNMKGDGTLLGGSVVIGSGSQGILFQHQSREFGDRANLEDIARAVEQINN